MDLATAVDSVADAAAACAQADLDTVDVVSLRTELVRIKRAMSKLDAQVARITRAADRRGAHLGSGARDTAEWIAKQTGTTTRSNRSAAELGEAMEKSPALADAIDAGDVSNQQASAAVGAAGGLAIDGELLDEIASLPVAGVRAATEQWRARQEEHAEADRAAQQRERRFLRLTGQADGMTRIEGLLDPDAASVVRTTLDAIISDSAFDNTARRRDQRCADALTQLAKAASKGDIRGGRSNAKVLATVPFETIVERATARGVTHAGPTVDADTVRQMACDAGIHRVIIGPGSSILDFGRENRLVSENLFLALVARDQHCRWPGCTIRATWCDAHHVTEWGHHGRTDERTCALLCHHHHSLTHQPGWKITGDGHHFAIHHPDGTTETSRPPGARTGEPPSRAGVRVDDSRPPPEATAPRADRVGREPGPIHAPATEQLMLT